MRVALALLAMSLSGAGLVAAGFGDRRPRALQVAMAAALGLGTWSAGYAAALLLFGPSAMPWKDAVLAAAGLGLLLKRKKNFFFAEGPQTSSPPWLWALFAAACAIAAALFLEHTRRFPDGGWDAWMVWNLRARFLARGGEGFRAAFSPDMLFLAHQDYPFLLPGIVAQGWLLAGAESPWIPAGVAFLYGALAVALLTLSVRWLRGEPWGLLSGLALAAMPCFPTFASNQQSDVPLAVYLLIAMALVTGRAHVLGGFAAGLAMWTKNEGSLYVACLAFAMLWRERDLKALARFALGAAPAAALLAGFKLGLAPPTDLAALSTRQSLLQHALDLHRWGELALLTLRRIVYFQDFALWAVAEVLLLLLWVRKRPPTTLGTALFLSFAAYAPIYVLQPHRLDWIYRTSADRLFIQLWPAAVLATALHLSDAAKAPAQTTART